MTIITVSVGIATNAVPMLAALRLCMVLCDSDQLRSSLLSQIMYDQSQPLAMSKTAVTGQKLVNIIESH